MQLKNIFLNNPTLRSTFIIAILTFFALQCTPTTPIEIEKKTITEFHQKSELTKKKLNANFDLYVDYSTCVADAVAKSDFFKQIRPRVTGLNPTLYGIKDPSIEKISNSSSIVNQELNSIKEINFANIEGACHKICDGNNQAMLITDGEFWTVGIGERTDLAYMKDSFVKWITKGYEIFIYVEPYFENYKGSNYQKKRFYFIFTEDNLQNNINLELNKAFFSSARNPNIKLFKLSNTEIRITDKFVINSDLDFSPPVLGEKFTAYEIYNDWEDLDEFILNANNPQDDSPIEGGDYLIRGLKMESEPLSPYSYTELDLKVYNVSSNYIENQKIDFNNIEITDIFILDKDLYKKKGEIGIKMSENYSSGLSEVTDNLLRIDIIAKATTTTKKLSKNDFEWKSLTKTDMNSSVFESILQTLDSPLIDPAYNGQVLYTIYLKTNSLE